MNSDLALTAGMALTIKSSPRARVLRLRVDPRTGGVLLIVPRRISRRRALAWAAGQRAWVEKALADIPPVLTIRPGVSVPLYGEPHLIDWQADLPRTVRLEPGRLVLGGPLEAVEGRVLRWLRQHSRATLDRETREYAAKAGVMVAGIGVGDPTSRWGSCSAAGAIRYSWRLILAPEWVRRATVAHEVAHRVHMNHGPHFHALVATLFGADPAPARAWLRVRGVALHRVGRAG